MTEKNPTMLAQRLFPGGGYYVEAGAHDGVGDSHTYSLEKTGLWRGLCVEPSSAYHGLTLSRRCSTDRRCLGPRDGERLTFREVAGEAVELSGLVEHFGDQALGTADHWDRETRPHSDREVETVSLTTLLSQHQAPPFIELLVLDTEGSEQAILSTHDFSRFRFGIILVEHNGVEARRRGLLDLLASCGYSLIRDTGKDLILIHDSLHQGTDQ